jgi:hypothetical protein
MFRTAVFHDRPRFPPLSSAKHLSGIECRIRKGLLVTMRISFTDEITDGRILYSIGRVSAAGSWHAAGTPCARGDWREAALQALIQEASEHDADAIIGVDYAVDGAHLTDLTSIGLERVTASGIAVKLATA